MDNKSVASVLEAAQKKLLAVGLEDALRSAQVLMCFALSKPLTYVMAHPEAKLSKAQLEIFQTCINERSQGKPVAYITKEKEFYGRSFYVCPDVLIPRPETEILIDAVLRQHRKRKVTSVLDVGTGSGILPITLGKEIAPLQITAVDISQKALAVASRNAKTHGAKIEFFQSDLFEHVEGRFDCIVSNLPYIDPKEILKLDKDVKDYEPRLALDGGKQGLEILYRLIDEAKKYCHANAMIALEIGFDQAALVSQRLKKQGFVNIEVIQDYQSLDRIVIAFL